jgi:hypothetical protein
VTPTPNPALVAQSAAQRLPRAALLLFCAAYVLPGLFGRDPWRSADQSAFGYMLAMAEGRTPWGSPVVGGLALDSALPPHWLGAASIWLFSPFMDAPLAARLPFGLILALVLVLSWYACFQLARTEAAQPLAFAFGGEADPVSYARAIADGALLALIATLGLLQPGHETTPELLQMFAAALGLWSLAAAPFRIRRARLAALVAWPLLAACGAPAMALMFGLAGVLIAARSSYAGARGFAAWLAAATTLAVVAAWALGTWAWRVRFQASGAQFLQLARLLVWFLWPAWLLALWTIWRWRHHLGRRHVAIPLAFAAASLAACVAGGGSEQALMIGLPAFAVLAAFALPTLGRSASAAVDWFSVFAFTLSAITIWVIYSAMLTGVPAQPAANVARLAPGFQARFAALPFAIALAATLTWLALVRWRTGRHRAALWKSLVLPAGGVALAWLLLMTLWLPLLDYARSMRPWVVRLAPYIPSGACIDAPGQPRVAVASLELYGPWRVEARPERIGACAVQLLREMRGQSVDVPAGWELVARLQRPTDRDETTLVLRRLP